MKRIIFLLTLVLMFANANCVSAATNVKAETKAIKNILKSQISAANKYDYPEFVKYFDLQYVNSDGFNMDVYSKLVEDTWASYSNIQYAQKVKNISVNGKDAIAEVVETANAQVESQYNLKGNLKSIANNIYFLKKTPDGWKIVSDVILTEDTYLSFGELVNHEPFLNVPYQTLAGRNYTATLEFTTPKETIAIASINQERVSYPQESAKENYRKLPEDGILERFFTANSENTNEYVVASLGLTRPVFDNKDLQINVTGVAYIIKRVNVIPENKFINAEGVTSVAERLEKIKAAEAEVSKSKEPEQKEIKKSKKENKVEEKSVSAEVVDKAAKKQKKTKPEKVEKVVSPVDVPTVEKDTEIAQPGDKVRKPVKEKKVKEPKSKEEKTPVQKPEKVKKEKSLKGTYSPAPIDIPTQTTVCPIEETEPSAVEPKKEVKTEPVQEEEVKKENVEETKTEEVKEVIEDVKE